MTGTVHAPCAVQIRELQQLYDATGQWPSLNEIEVHPYWHEDALIDFCFANGITVVNYAPLAKGEVLTDPAVIAVAAAHGVTPAQAVLRWGLQRTNGIVIPRSVNVSHVVVGVAHARRSSCGGCGLVSGCGYPGMCLQKCAPRQSSPPYHLPPPLRRCFVVRRQAIWLRIFASSTFLYPMLRWRHCLASRRKSGSGL
jgi:hypothetical protein